MLWAHDQTNFGGDSKLTLLGRWWGHTDGGVSNGTFSVSYEIYQMVLHQAKK